MIQCFDCIWGAGDGVRAMGFTHRFYMSPFQGFFGGRWGVGDGLYPSFLYVALSMGFTHRFYMSPFQGFFGG